MKSKALVSLLLTAVFTLPFHTNRTAYAACTLQRVKGQFTIVCSGTTAGGFIGSNSRDILFIESGAELVCSEGVPEGQDATGASLDTANGNDSVQNNGTVSVQVSSGGGTPDDQNDAFTAATAATGIDSGNGKDVIVNDNVVSASSSANADLGDVFYILSGKDEIEDTTAVSAFSWGIDSGNGKDEVTNNGNVSATSEAEIDALSISHNLIDAAHADTSMAADASSTGITSGNGKDTITNAGDITARATADIDVVSVESDIVDAASADTTITPTATAVGIDAGGAKDDVEILNTGTVTAEAIASVTDVGVTVTFADVTIVDQKGNTNAGTTLQATAVGIRGGNEKDTITNEGTVSAVASSDATSVGVSIASEGVPGSTKDLIVNGKLADASITAHADALGIDGGNANDDITNAGTLISRATSETTQASANLGVGIFDFKVPTPGLVLGSAATISNATSMGISGGSGTDVIRQEGLMDVDASSSASAVTVSANISELGVKVPGLKNKKFPLEGSISFVLSDTSTVAMTSATGIEGGMQNDDISNSGISTVNATSDADATSVSVTWGKAKGKFLLEGSVARSETRSESEVQGITGGYGDDVMTNSGDFTSAALSDATSTGVDVALQGRFNTKLTVGAALADTSAVGIANSMGFTGDEGRDVITNTGSLTSSATSDVDSTSVSVDVQAEGEGFLAVGGALARSSTQAQTWAVGISGGDKRDDLTNEGDLTSSALSMATSGSGSLNFQGFINAPAAAGVALTDASATSSSRAVGIEGGTDDDTITNAGNLHTTAVSDNDAVSVSASVQIKQEGKLALSGALANAENRAESTDIGIDGGEGDDQLLNTGTIFSEAHSGALSVGVGMSFMGFMNSPVAIGAALTDTSATAISSATGITGGSGTETITSSGIVNAVSTSDVDAVSVSANLQFEQKGLLVGAALARSESTAMADAVGIDAHEEDADVIADTVYSTARADTTAVSVGLNVQGVSKGAGVGGAITETSSLAFSNVTGIMVNDLDNVITSADTIRSIAVSDLDAVGVSVSAGIANTGAAIGLALANSGTTSEAHAVGVDGAGGIDTIATHDVTAGAIANTTAVSANLSFEKAKTGASLGAALMNTTALATSTAMGIGGGTGNDSLLSAGTVTAKSTADTDAVGVTVNVAYTGTGAAIGAALSSAETTADAAATGLDAGEGDDTILSKDVNTAALANTTAVNVGVGIEKASTGASIGAALLDSDALAKASTTSAKGGSGNDYIESTGTVTSKSTADTDAVGVTVNVAYTGTGAAIGAALSRAETTADAYATGLDGGEGDDTILSKDVNTAALANTTAVSVGVGISGVSTGAGIGAALMDSDALAKASATGVKGSSGNDYIESTGTVTANSTADTDAVGVTVNAAFAGTGAAIGASLSSAETTADATATGLDGGDGDDTILSKGVNTAALANTTAVSVGMSISGAGTGAGIGAALMDSDALAKATATGIQGGAGTDTLQSGGDISVSATADTDSVGVTVGLTFAGTGAALGAALADSETIAEALSKGIDGVEGDVVTEGNITSHAVAKTTAVNVTANIAGAGTGAALGAALMDTDASAAATAVGVAGSDGGSLINTRGATLALSTAEVDGTGVSVGIGATGTGVGGGAALAESGIRTDARAWGIDAGGGDDDVLSEGDVIAGAWSDITSTQVTANISGTGTGAAIGAALMDTSSVGSASSTGVTGGSGMDIVSSEGHVTSTASSFLTATDVSVSLGFAGTGAALGAALSKSSHTAISNAVGLDGAAQDDAIESAETVSATSVSDIDATDVTVSVTGTAEGFAGSAALTDSTTNALSSATGISGGGGGDTVVTHKEVTSYARSEVDAASVSVSLAAAPVAGGAALTDASTLLAARSAGIDGGEGSDDITSYGSIEAHASSDVDVAGVSTNLSLGVGGGAALAKAGSIASADARAVEGGLGDDVINSRGAVISNSTTIADATSVAVNIGLLGYADSDADILAQSQSWGLSGGEGSDTITNMGGIVAKSDSQGYAGAVSVNLLGGAMGEVTTTASSFSSGMDGGEGADALYNEAAIASTATSYGQASATVVQIGGYSNSDASTNAFANAVGMGGGEGDDTISNNAPVDVLGSATGKAVSVNVNLLGATFADAETLIRAAATGLDGGGGNDMLDNAGPLVVDATAFGDAQAVGVTVLGYGDAGATTNVAANSTGMHGGEGDDYMRSTGDITVYGTGQGQAKSVNVTPVGALSVDADTLVQAFGRGMEGGGGDDTIYNEGAIYVDAKTTTESKSVGVVIGGFADAGASANAVTDAAGITGGEGKDAILTTGDITVLSSATGDSEVTNVTLLGSAIADAGTNAITNAVGIDGGGDVDFIQNEADVFAMTTSNMTADSSSINIFGNADSVSTVTSRSYAGGITGGEGDDSIFNYGTVTANSFSTLVQDGSSFTLGGASSETGVLAAYNRSRGIAGGEGADIINSVGAVSVVTSSSLSSDGDSTAVFGASDTGGSTGAVTIASGIEGEGGDDVILSASTVNVQSTATLDVQKGAFSFAGSAGATATLTADTQATGISGGEGEDRILSNGGISATANAYLTSSTKATVIFGSSYASSTISADTTAMGIEGGGGDDIIESHSTVGVSSSAVATMEGSSFAFGGTSQAGGTLTASTRALGISGGSGEDWVLSDGSMAISASATLTSANKADSVFGSASSSAIIGSVTEGVCLEAGEGDDTVLNRGDISAIVYSTTSSSASSWVFGGGEEAKAFLTAGTRSSGIAGGGGMDQILNEGSITVRGESVLSSVGGGKATFGRAKAGSQIRADAFAVGVDGGDADDTIENAGAVDVSSTANLTSNTTSASFAGGSATSELLTAFSNAVGLDGGGGSDDIWNRGDVTVDATAVAKSLGGASSDLAGGASASGVISVDVNAAGVHGGITNSVVINSAGIAVTATAEPQATHSASAGFFYSGGFAAADAAARLTESGVSVGDGDNEILNEGIISLEMSSGTRDGDGDGTLDGVFARVDAEGGDFDLFLGNADAHGRATADATTGQTGILAGDGENIITNRGDVAISTSPTVGFKVSAVSDPNGGGALTVDGDGYGEAYASGTFTSAGISAGTGVNQVVNDGRILLGISPEVVSVVDADGPSSVGSGDADSFARSSANASAFGISVGANDEVASENWVVNNGEISVMASPSARAFADSNGQVFDGDGRCGYSDDPIKATGTALATGIMGGIGINRADNYGMVNATAAVSAYARGNSDSDTGGDAWTYEWAIGSARAEAIHAGAGQSQIVNHGYVAATATVDADTWGWADRAMATAEGDSTSNTWAYADAFGILADGGDVSVENAGIVDVNATADATAFAHGDDDSYSHAFAYGSAYGIYAGAGLTPIYIGNSGLINATSRSIALTQDDEPTMSARGADKAYGIKITGGDSAVASGGDIFVSSSAFAYFQSSNDHVATTVSSSTATGIELGDGGTRAVDAGGRIIVSAVADNEPSGVSFVRTLFGLNSATADAFGINAGNGDAAITVQEGAEVSSASMAHTVSSDGIARALASGISAASGNIIIGNQGTIRANALGTADYSGPIPFTFDSLVSGSGSASGIATGAQGDTVLNTGDIVVEASGNATVPEGDNFLHIHMKSVASAWAIGIDAGGGNNWIENDGVITVSSVATAGTEFVLDGSASASAVGIRTGSGDDVIINRGSITTTVTENLLTYAGVAINSGGGNDSVILNSFVAGDIDLGLGDDSLSFGSGGEVKGHVTGNEGTDSLIFDNVETFSASATSFENLLKLGSSTLTIPVMPVVEQLEIEEGILEVTDDYSPQDGLTIITQVEGDGKCGMLKVDGVASLDGTLEVRRGPGAYVDGTTFNVLSADAITGSLEERVPAATPLLSFELNREPDNIEVEVSTERFITVATNPVERAIAEHLDEILPSVAGDLSVAIGEFQALPKPEQYRAAFLSLSPGSYDGLTRTTYGVARQHAGSLINRMQSVRMASAASSYASRTKPALGRELLLVAFNGSDFSFGHLADGQYEKEKADYGLWSRGFGQWGEQDGEAGFSGFDFSVAGLTLGLDHAFGDRFIAGVSLAASFADIDLHNDMGRGDIDSIFGSIYGTYFSKKGYIEGVLSYGGQDYSNSRDIVIGPLASTASSKHDGDVFSAFGGGGYNFILDSMVLQPFASLQYVLIDEDAFLETGAGALNLSVGARKTDSLVSSVGLRAARVFSTDGGSLLPEISAAWNYDFDIDERVITASLEGSPDAAFSIAGQKVERNGATLGTGITFMNRDGFSTRLKYSAEIRENYEAHGVMGELRYEF
ncbi:MAG: autotransporter outer membrane beta-barrel domain-containing protein [Nitrospirota bacterium]